MKNQKLNQRNIVMFIGIIAVSSLSTLSLNAQMNADTTDVFDMSLEALLNIDVTTASKSAEKQSDAPGIISILTKDELERFGGTTLKDILDRVPGLISYGNQFSDISTIAVRGDQSKVTSAHVLFLNNSIYFTQYNRSV